MPMTMKKSERWMLAILAVLALLSAEALMPPAHHGLGFYAWFSALSCLLIIAIALSLGRPLRRRDTYYGERKRK